MQQVRKATEIISHRRTFGRAAPVSYEPLVIEWAIGAWDCGRTRVTHL
jgi:hypothetical protein